MAQVRVGPAAGGGRSPRARAPAGGEPGGGRDGAAGAACPGGGAQPTPAPTAAAAAAPAATARWSRGSLRGCGDDQVGPGAGRRIQLTVYDGWTVITNANCTFIFNHTITHPSATQAQASQPPASHSRIACRSTSRRLTRARPARPSAPSPPPRRHPRPPPPKLFCPPALSLPPLPPTSSSCSSRSGGQARWRSNLRRASPPSARDRTNPWGQEWGAARLPLRRPSRRPRRRVIGRSAWLTASGSGRRWRCASGRPALAHQGWCV